MHNIIIIGNPLVRLAADSSGHNSTPGSLSLPADLRAAALLCAVAEEVDAHVGGVLVLVVLNWEEVPGVRRLLGLLEQMAV